MKHIYCFALLLCVLLYSGCKKSYISPITFADITVTDTSCIYISDVDTTDWAYDAAWTTAEYAFINFNDSVPITDSLPGFVQVSAICPNPNAGAFVMNVTTERECMMRMACVNTEMQILHYSVKRMPGGTVTTHYDFVTSNTAFHKDESYRIYYGFYTKKDSLYYKGHGDFRIE